MGLNNDWLHNMSRASVIEFKTCWFQSTYPANDKRGSSQLYYYDLYFIPIYFFKFPVSWQCRSTPCWYCYGAVYSVQHNAYPRWREALKYKSRVCITNEAQLAHKQNTGLKKTTNRQTEIRFLSSSLVGAGDFVGRRASGSFSGGSTTWQLQGLKGDFKDD